MFIHQTVEDEIKKGINRPSQEFIDIWLNKDYKALKAFAEDHNIELSPKYTDEEMRLYILYYVWDYNNSISVAGNPDFWCLHIDGVDYIRVKDICMKFEGSFANLRLLRYSVKTGTVEVMFMELPGRCRLGVLNPESRILCTGLKMYHGEDWNKHDKSVVRRHALFS